MSKGAHAKLTKLTNKERKASRAIGKLLVKNKIYFDLRGYAKYILINLGFSNIWCSSDDTYKEFSEFFSYRYSMHNKFIDYGRMLSVIKT